MSAHAGKSYVGLKLITGEKNLLSVALKRGCSELKVSYIKINMMVFVYNKFYSIKMGPQELTRSANLRFSKRHVVFGQCIEGLHTSFRKQKIMQNLLEEQHSLYSEDS